MSRNRFPGLRAFEERDAAIFNGRAKEKQAFFDLLMVERSVLLFAKSGTGKTSLLKAGIAPMLPPNLWQPVFLRLNHPNQTLLQQTFAQIAAEFGIANRVGQTLWEYLQCINKNTSGVTPVLFFDQFEEIFTLTKDEADRRDFTVQLADVVNETLPKGVRERLQNEADFKDAQRLEIEKPPRVKVVFSIRSDMLRYMHEFSNNIPSILRNRFELKGLIREQAVEAIVNPASATDPSFDCPSFAFSPEALDDILQNLAAKHTDGGGQKEIESFQLQLLCSQLEQKMLLEHQQGKAPLVVEISTYGGRAGIERLLSEFYQNTLECLQDEQQRQNAHVVIEEELVKYECRISVAEASLVYGTHAVTPDTLRLLVDKRLLRREERVDTGNYYELAHDTLVAPVLKFKEARRWKEAVDKAEQEREKERRRNRKAIGLASLFAVLAISTFVAWRVALYERTQSRVKHLTTASKLQYGQDRTLAFRLAEAAWELDQNNSEAIGAMIGSFYGDLPNYREGLTGAAHYQEFDAIWVKSFMDGKQFYFLSTDRHTIYLFDPNTGNLRPFETAKMPKIEQAALSPDGATLVTIHREDSIARWWNTAGEAKILRHNGPVLSVAFSNDGRYFTTNAADEKQYLWSANGEVLAVYRNVSNTDLVPQAAFSPDNRHLLVLEDDQTLHLFPLSPNSGPAITWKEPDGKIVNAVFASNNGNLGLFVSRAEAEGQQLRVLDQQGRLIEDKAFPISTDLISDIQPDSSGSCWAISGGDGNVSLWTPSKNEVVALGTCTERHTKMVIKTLFAPVENLIASAGTDKTVRLWDRLRLVSTLHHPDWIKDMRFSHDGRYLAVITDGDKLRVWSLFSFRPVALQTKAIPIFSSYVPKANEIYAQDADGRWYRWDMKGDTLALPAWLAETDPCHAVPWDSAMFIQRKNGALSRWNLLKGDETPLGNWPCSDLTPIAAPKTGLLALCHADSILIVDKDGKRVASLGFPNYTVKTFSWSADGQSLFSVLSKENDHTELWEWSKNSQSARKLPTFDHVISAMTGLFRNKEMLFGIEGGAHIWRNSTEQPTPYLLRGHEAGSPLVSLDVLPEKHLLVTAALDQQVVLWNDQGQWLHAFNFPDMYGPAHHVAFSPNGDYLLTQHYGQTIFLWPIAPRFLKQMMDINHFYKMSSGERAIYGID